LPELTIAKESKLKSGCAGSLDLQEAELQEKSISAMFGNFGSSGN
jgi:hypothetical protein